MCDASRLRIVGDRCGGGLSAESHNTCVYDFIMLITVGTLSHGGRFCFLFCFVLFICLTFLNLENEPVCCG